MTKVGRGVVRDESAFSGAGGYSTREHKSYAERSLGGSTSVPSPSRQPGRQPACWPEPDVNRSQRQVAARAMVATMVAERLNSHSNPPSVPPSPSTPPPPPPQAASASASPSPPVDMVPAPATLANAFAPGAAAARQRAASAAGSSRPSSAPPVAPVASRPPPAPLQLAQRPQWRGASSTARSCVPPPASAAGRASPGRASPGRASSGRASPAAAGPSAGPNHVPALGPRYPTREQLAERLAEAIDRAVAAEGEAEALHVERSALEEELDGLRRGAEGSAGEVAASRSAAIAAGKLEVSLRASVEELTAQLQVAAEGEAAAREAARAAEVATAAAKLELDASRADAAAAEKRAERGEARLREMREALGKARGTQGEVASLTAQLQTAQSAAVGLQRQVNEEASGKRSAIVALREAREKLKAFKEATARQGKEAEDELRREIATQKERCTALRYVNGNLEGRLRSLFDSKLRETSKASTLQDAVQMLTDEYVAVVEQLRTANASLTHEKRRASSVDRQQEEKDDIINAALQVAAEERVHVSLLAKELAHDDVHLMPALSARALEVAGLQVRHAQSQRTEAQLAAASSSSQHAADAAVQRIAADAARAHDEVALLKKRLAASLRRTRELEGQLEAAGVQPDAARAARWLPPASPPASRQPRNGPPRSATAGSPTLRVEASSPQGSPGSAAGLGTDETYGGAASPSSPLPREGAEEMPSPLTVQPVAFIA